MSKHQNTDTNQERYLEKRKMAASYFKYWGKALQDKDQPGPSYHLLPYHCLDVAAVGQVLLKQNQPYCENLTRLTKLNSEYFIPWCTFLLALHDVGKFADSFQNLKPALLQALQSRVSNRQYALRHDSLGLILWKKHLRQQVQKSGLIPQITWSHRRQAAEQPIDIWISAMVGHHGEPPKPYTNRILTDDFDTTNDFVASSEFLSDLIPILLPERPEFPADNIQTIKLASWWLAGLAVLCDWLGSNTRFFPYQDELIPLPDYWKQTLKRAEQAINTTSILSCEPSFSLKLNKLIEVGHTASIEATPLQALVSSRNIPTSPHLFILEDVTGAGKTEAAVLLAHRLMEAGQGNSIYFALPTMATANSMYSRMANVYRKMFSAGSLPSLVLAHGSRDMSGEFRSSILPETNTAVDSYGDETFEAGAHCNAWLADNRKKAMLADVGVGTVDQVLLAILPARHQSLRLLGMINKILLIDEVHACDAYMHELLCVLLKAQAASGGSVILLSATLPKKQRQALLVAYAEGQGWPEPELEKFDVESYPLVTCLNAGGLSEEIIDTRDSVKRTVNVVFLSTLQAADDVLSEVVARGQCGCWIRNTVKDAVEAYQQIKNGHPDWQVDLFHARYALGDRLDIEKRVVERFGKNSTSDMRQGRILIATQVVEQSLDLDFDTMITDLAPIDLLIQRAGRLCRHTRDQAGNPIENKDQRGAARLHIHSPEITQSPDENWYGRFFKNAARVYENHGQLWLTASLLHNHGKFQMPGDARNMVENVYSEEAQNNIPEPLLNRSFEAEGKERADASIARLNALTLEVGYTDFSTNRWWDEAKTPTRLGDETTTVYLSKWEEGTLKPWRNDTNHAWQLSAVSMRTYWIDTELADEEITQEHIEQCKADLPAGGKWGVLLPLSQSSDDNWCGKALNGQKEAVHFVYDKDFGLMVTD